MLNEVLYLVVITYADGSNYTYEAYSKEAAEDFINSYDDLFVKYEIYEAVVIKERFYNEV